jgi:hypothetical protein
MFDFAHKLRSLCSPPAADRSLSFSRQPFVQKSMQLHQRKLYALRKRLQRYPQAVTAILQTAGSLNRPVDTLQPQDVRSLG